MKLKDCLHEHFLKYQDQIEDWFQDLKIEEFPFYSSFDIRESCSKIAPVDANLFPAGFNNICQDDREAMVDLLKEVVECKELECKNLALFCENNLKNKYYWDNVAALKELFESQGFKVFVVLPDLKPELQEIESAAGKVIPLSSVELREGQTYVDNSKIDFIISNNDYSSDSESWIKEVSTPSLPPRFMGWHKRRKESFFKHYNRLAEDFCRSFDLDPFMMSIKTETFNDFAIEDAETLKALSERAQLFQDNLKQEHSSRKLEQDPYLFVKNSYGTYGLGVLEVKDPKEILSWNYKSRKKMKATKGGGGVSSVILQEGIPTTLKVGEDTAEAVIYLLGSHLAGGFFRTHSKKGHQDSLNSPGAVFKRMCFSDYEFQKENKILENVYGTVARVGAAALSLEIQEARAQEA